MMLDAPTTSSNSPSSSSRVLLLAGAAAAGGACLWLARRTARQQQQQQHGARTDFDAFLHAPPPPAAATPAAARQATCFEAFLHVPPPAPAATDFAAFLRAPPGAAAAGAGTGAAAAGGAAAAAEAERVPGGAVPVLVLFGTEYGFAREVAEAAAARLKGSGRYWPALIDVADHPHGYEPLCSSQAALLVFSTQGDGVPPTQARGFCEWLAAGAASSADSSGARLSRLRFSVCALGDRSYTHFCACGAAVDAALTAAGAAALAPRVDVNREDWDAIDAWLSATLGGLDAAAAAEAAAPGGLPRLATFDQLGGPAAVPGFGASSSGGSSGGDDSSSGYTRSRPYYARVLGVEGLCQLRGADDKAVVRLSLALEPNALAAGGLAYEPGDALGIWPTNAPEVVDELLAALGASGDELVPRPGWHYAEAHEQQQQQQQQGGGPQRSASLTLRHALSVCYDLRSPKARALLQLLAAQLPAAPAKPQQPAVRASIELQADATAAGAGAAATQPPGARGAGEGKPGWESAPAAQRLAQLLDADAAALEAYLAPRHVADVLEDLGGCGRITPQQLLGVLRPLAPRLYSISSSPLEARPHGSVVEATIAVVRYTSLAKRRAGVASSQAGERLAAGQLLPVFVSPNPDFRLPQNPGTPLVMVGPGTGLAPFRAFILHRLLQAQNQQQQLDKEQQPAAAPPGPMQLFFGCRRRDQDFLYGAQLAGWHAAGAVTLHTAFSREGPAKVYVQDRLAEAAAAVWAALEAGGHFYVCGDAGSMAGAVEAALLRIIAAHLPQQEGQGQQQPSGEAAADAAAQAYLAQLAAEGRYQRDVWFA